MARFALFLILVICCASCAEIIPLTGGEQDEFAPKIEQQQPEQGALFVSENQIKIEFDEYFKLNEPATSITMNPAVGKLTSVAKNKTLLVTWDSILKPNTTYILQLNGTIRDLNENNDTIIQIVFSSGNSIDSLTISGRIEDAFTNVAYPKSTICLFQPTADIYSTSALYLTQSDAKGSFSFSYLRPGNYQLIAFNDANKDQQIGKTESIGFSDSLVVAGDSNLVTLRMFSPKSTINRLQVKIETPGLASISGKDLSSGSVQINGTEAKKVQQFRADSIVVALPIIEGNTFRFIYQEDTVVRTLSKDEKMQQLIVQPISKQLNWRENDTLFYYVNALVSQIDTSLISIKNEKNETVKFAFDIENNSIYLVPKELSTQNTFFTTRFLKTAVKTEAGNSSDSISFRHPIFRSSDLSSLVLDCESLEGNWVIQLTDGESVIGFKTKNSNLRKITFDRLFPGKYAVRCIEDSNNNGIWDTGNELLKIQPERVVRFELNQKLRPNWEIEEVLKLKKE